VLLSYELTIRFQSGRTVWPNMKRPIKS